MQELFSQLQSSTETALPPDALRRALASTFFDQNRFQLGCMDDAAECFENMLIRIHAHVAPSADEDMCDARHCVPHRKFAMTLVEQTTCSPCGATSEPLSYTQVNRVNICLSIYCKYIFSKMRLIKKKQRRTRRLKRKWPNSQKKISCR